MRDGISHMTRKLGVTKKLAVAKKLVVVGNGMAPGRMLEHLLEKASGQFEVTIFNAEPRVNYDRIMLSPVLSGEKEYEEIIIHGDGWYVRNGITKWVFGWERNGWLTAAKQPVKNADLWRRLRLACERHQVQWFWVKGHSGITDNELADVLATRGMQDAIDGSHSQTTSSGVLSGLSPRQLG